MMRDEEELTLQRQYAEKRRIMADVYTFEIETRRDLPMSAYRIAEIEMAGGIVNLETGEVFYPKEEEQHADTECAT